MIVRRLPDERLLCINQTAHATMAEAFCRHWGNADFARPEPFDAVMLAIGQHDNGWLEWEQRPRLRPDGYPMDFVNDDDALGKVALWQRGIERVAAQHPYSGLLVANHAAILYGVYAGRNLDETTQQAIQGFVDDVGVRAATLRAAWCNVREAEAWLDPRCVLANTRLLQFGDMASLQVIMPWEPRRNLQHCPVDFAGAETTITMTYDDTTTCFDPWPFGVPEFTVSIFGRVLERTHFVDDAAYHAALAAAPFQMLTWRVAPAG